MLNTQEKHILLIYNMALYFMIVYREHEDNILIKSWIK